MELSRFLDLALTEEEIKAEGISDLLNTIKEGESKVKMTDQEMNGGDQFRREPRSKLHPSGRKPSDQERKRLTAIALGWLVGHIMTNFLYNFGGVDRMQEEGGPMGDELMQALSRFIGMEYDNKFLETLERLKVELSYMTDIWMTRMCLI